MPAALKAKAHCRHHDPEQPARGIQVLVIEDEPDLLDLLTYNL